MYRAFIRGAAVECDSAADVVALLALLPTATTVGVDLAHGVDRTVETPVRAKATRRISRRPVRARVMVPRRVVAADAGDTGPRRDVLLKAIKASPVGLTRGELKRVAAKGDVASIGNDLTVLKGQGVIRRNGNAWVAA